MKKSVAITLDEELLKRIDEKRELIKRSTYMEHMLYAYFKKEKK